MDNHMLDYIEVETWYCDICDNDKHDNGYCRVCGQYVDTETEYI